MKKLYILFLISGFFGFSQPTLTAILDGPCTGGLPKVCEIYANGTVDFTTYSFQNQVNANTTWGTAVDLSSFGTKTNEFVYVVYTGGNLAVATTEFPGITASNSLESSAMNLNGDDRVRIILTSDSSVIDQFGVSDTDGTGLSWEWLDSYAKRNNGTGPDAGFTESNWTITAINSLDGTGACNSATALQDIVALGSYTLSTRDFGAIDGLKIYPNPLNGNTLFLTSSNNLEMNVKIYDVLGKEVLNGKTVNNAINVSNLTSGVYIVKITEADKTATRKLVVR